jgi:hypothetical protein
VAGLAAEARFELRSASTQNKRPGAIPAFFDLRVVIVRERGRSSIPRVLDSISDGGDYVMPAFAGMKSLCVIASEAKQSIAPRESWIASSLRSSQ